MNKKNLQIKAKSVTWRQFDRKHDAIFRSLGKEIRIGVLAVSNDDGMLSDGERFTSPKQAKEFVALTGVDSLAVSIGTNHGVNKYIDEPKIRYDILKKIEKEIPSIPIVLHGASLVEQKYIQDINNFGGKIDRAIGNENLLKNAYKTHICKINMYSMGKY